VVVQEGCGLPPEYQEGAFPEGSMFLWPDPVLSSYLFLKPVC